MRISIIHEERDFLVLDKPAGIAVHPVRGPSRFQRDGSPDLGSELASNGVYRGAGVKEKTLVDWLVKKYPETKQVGDNPKERPGIVHRLDKDTSGVMIAARTQEAFEALKKLFKERKVEKIYLALAVGTPKKRSGVIAAPIGRSARQPTKRAADTRALRQRAAITVYRLLERLGPYSLLEVKPKTGRMHQIRVHLVSIGLPVAGDILYGGKRAEFSGLERQFLHAWRLEFSYPEGRRLRFESPLPRDLQAVLKLLRKTRNIANAKN